MNPPTDLVQTLSQLWQLKRSDSFNLFAESAFIRLYEICSERYVDKPVSKSALKFALSHALSSLGLPAHLTAQNEHLMLSPELAAVKIDVAFRQTQSKRTHLCPLDYADKLPTLNFGPNSVRELTAADLRTLVDSDRIQRSNPNWIFDADRFSQFTWLVVEEVICLDSDPGVRSGGTFKFNAREDLGAIKPHPTYFPTAVEDALFPLMLVPWDKWLEYPDIDPFAFRIPWIYTVDEDLFVSPSPPPSPDTLTWEPYFYHDWHGVEIESERPFQLPMDVNDFEIIDLINDTKWADIKAARQSKLFQTPIVHFVIRALQANGVDEFLTHLIVLEAVLGMHKDFSGGPKLKGNPRARIE